MKSQQQTHNSLNLSAQKRSIFSLNSRTFSLALGALLLSLTQVAVVTEASAASLRETVRFYQNTCPNLRCDDSAMQVRTPSADELSQLPVEIKTALVKRSKTAAQEHWPDTVLEGPYQTNFRLRIEAIEFLTLNDQVVGYRISLSAPAWDTETCAFDPRNKSTLKSCEEGRIHESMFISKDLSELFVDERAYADFVPRAE